MRKLELTYTLPLSKEVKRLEIHKETIDSLIKEVLHFYFNNGQAKIKKLKYQDKEIEFLKETKDLYFDFEEHYNYLMYQMKDVDNYKYDYAGVVGTGTILQDDYTNDYEEE